MKTMPEPSGIRIRLVHPDDLEMHELQLWSALLDSSPELNSPFLRPEFALAVNRVRNDVEIAILERAGRTVGFFPFQRWAFNIGKPVGGRLSNTHGVVASPDAHWTAEALIRGCRLAAWDFEHLLACQSAFSAYQQDIVESAVVDLSNGYETWVRERRASGSNRVPKVQSLARKLDRDHGPIHFEFMSRDQRALEQLMEWKSAQLRATGYTDLFQFEWTRTLLRDLASRSSPELHGVVSVLSVSDRPIAISYKLRSHGTMNGWFIGFDTNFGKYSPGFVLLLRIAEAAVREGVTCYELGPGDEQFKHSFASSHIPLAAGSVPVSSYAKSIRPALQSLRRCVKTSPLSRPLRIPIRIARRIREWSELRCR